MSVQDKPFLQTPDVISQESSARDVVPQISLRQRLDELVELEQRQLRANAYRRPSRRELLRLAIRMYDARRTRDRIMSRELFGEPAWDMLLALYCLPARGWIMTVKAVSCAADVPSTTGLRWQQTLIDEGLIERGPEATSLAKILVRLTPKGRALMDVYLTRLFYHDTPLPPDAPD